MTGSWVQMSPVWLAADPVAMAEVHDQMIVPTALPIDAVIAIATAPHTVTRSADLVACAPPTRAPMVNDDAENRLPATAGR